MIKQQLLYRKENKTTIQHKDMVIHSSHFRYERNSKNPNKSYITKGKMSPKNNLGYDLTPTIDYLNSRIGDNYDTIFSDINLILNNGYHKPLIKKEILDFINSIIHKNVTIEKDKILNNKQIELTSFFRCGESSYYDSFYIDENNILCLVKTITKNNFKFDIGCKCHTHSYNGKPYKYKE